MFRSSHFSFLVTFGDKVTKMQKYYIIFVYILQGKMGKTEKTQKEDHATKVTKNQKKKIWDEQNNHEDLGQQWHFWLDYSSQYQTYNLYVFFPP